MRHSMPEGGKSNKENKNRLRAVFLWAGWEFFSSAPISSRLLRNPPRLLSRAPHAQASASTPIYILCGQGGS